MNALPRAIGPVRVVGAGRFALALGSQLTVRETPALSDAVRDALCRRARFLTLDLRSVVAADAVGLAALVACQGACEALDVECSIAVGAELERQLIDAKLIEQLAVIGTGRWDDDQGGTIPVSIGATKRAAVAETRRIRLRQAGGDDVQCFREWAHDPLVDQMVGSDLLYRCRHLAADDPALVASIVHDPRALTVLVELPDGGRPVGFVRLYDVDLVSGFGFLETVVAERRSIRRGFGVAASRLLLAYCQDVMRIRRVEAKVYAYNLLSINGLRRNGFQQEGILREAHVYDNQTWDIFVFSILDREMTRERERDDLPSFHLFPDAGVRA